MRVRITGIRLAKMLPRKIIDASAKQMFVYLNGSNPPTMKKVTKQLWLEIGKKVCATIDAGDDLLKKAVAVKQSEASRMTVLYWKTVCLITHPMFLEIISFEALAKFHFGINLRF